ncbi:MAG: FAD-dependent oxidoreductase [Elusimicrobia bacterium]|nr:FAD-dependent oxidoreductase [Elusimicrobiota bacterium]
MPELAIIGQSPAVVSLIRNLRERGAGWDITLFSTEGILPYDRTRLVSLIGRKAREADLLCEAAGFYEKNGVRVVLDKEIARVNPSRRRIFFSDKTQVGFDALVLADAPQVRFAERKGVRKPGVFHLARLSTVKALVKHLVQADTVVIEAAGWGGIEAALAVRELGRKVMVVILPQFPVGEEGKVSLDVLSALLSRREIRMVSEGPLQDIIGEGEVRAVRFASDKVMAAEIVILEEVLPDLRFLSEGGLVVNERIVVASDMRTSAADVFAIDTVCELQEPRFFGHYAFDAERVSGQGEVVAWALSGETRAFSFPPENDRKTFERIFGRDLVEEVERELTPPPEMCMAPTTPGDDNGTQTS